MHFASVFTCIVLSSHSHAMPSYMGAGSRSSGQKAFRLDIGDDSSNNSSLAKWKEDVVASHNTHRAQYGAAPLTWRDDLYPDTLEWANNCNFEHSDSNAYGENLAAGTSQTYGFLEGLDSWMDEASQYDYDKPGYSPETGHFTQVVWKSTTQVACAMADCGAGSIFSQSSKYLVCRYSPPGNFVEDFRENVMMRQ